MPSSHSRAVAYTGRPWCSYWSRSLAPTSGWPTSVITAPACSPPMTLIRGVGPHEQEARRVRTSAHAVVARPEGPADHHGQLRDARRRDRRHELRAVLRDAARLVVAPDHEPRDVLHEQQRDAAQVAELDEVRALQRALAEQDPVVGDDAHRMPVEVREGRDQRRPVELLELLQLAGVDDPSQRVADVVGAAGVQGHEVQQAIGVLGGRPRRDALPRRHRRRAGACARCRARSPARAGRRRRGDRRRPRSERGRRRRRAPPR